MFNKRNLSTFALIITIVVASLAPVYSPAVSGFFGWLEQVDYIDYPLFPLDSPIKSDRLDDLKRTSDITEFVMSPGELRWRA